MEWEEAEAPKGKLALFIKRRDNIAVQTKPTGVHLIPQAEKEASVLPYLIWSCYQTTEAIMHIEFLVDGAPWSCAVWKTYLFPTYFLPYPSFQVEHIQGWS